MAGEVAIGPIPASLGAAPFSAPAPAAASSSAASSSAASSSVGETSTVASRREVAPDPSQRTSQDQQTSQEGAGVVARTTYPGGFTLELVDNSPQFFLQARDPATGAILVQVPAQEVTKGFRRVAVKTPRGSHFDSSL